VPQRFKEDFRRFFFRGLATVLPVVLTVVILLWLFAKIQQYIGRHINTAAQWVVMQFISIAWHRGPSLVFPDAMWQRVKGIWADYYLGWIGFLLAFVAIYIVGRLVASMVGRGLWGTVERTFFRLPVVKQVYPYVKQVVDFLLSEKKIELSRVVAVEYPRKGVWSLGLVTGPGMRTLHGALGGDLLTVFIPSSPTPVTGYTITVNRQEVVDLPISIDDALRFTVSGGVIMPRGQARSNAEIEQALQGVLPPPGRPRQEGDDSDYSR